MTKALHFAWKRTCPGESRCRAEYKWKRRATPPSLPPKSRFPQITTLFPYIIFLFASFLRKYSLERRRNCRQCLGTWGAPALRQTHVRRLRGRQPAPSFIASWLFLLLSFLCLGIHPIVVLPDQEQSLHFNGFSQSKLLHMVSCSMWNSHNKKQRFWTNFCLLLSLEKCNTR